VLEAPLAGDLAELPQIGNEEALQVANFNLTQAYE
jgi:hypothetical protein